MAFHPAVTQISQYGPNLCVTDTDLAKTLLSVCRILWTGMQEIQERNQKEVKCVFLFGWNSGCFAFFPHSGNHFVIYLFFLSGPNIAKHHFIWKILCNRISHLLKLLMKARSQMVSG